MKAEGRQRGNSTLPEPAFPWVRARHGGVRWRGRPVTGPGAYFGFLVRGHTEEGEKNAAVEAPLHVNNLGGRGHPLVELPGHIAQVGVQALLQGLVEDDLRQATGEQPVTASLGSKGLWTFRGSWPISPGLGQTRQPTPRDRRGINEPRAKHEFLKMPWWKAFV